MQITVLIISLTIMTAMSIIFALVIKSARQPEAAAIPEQRRTLMIQVMIVLGLAITILSLCPWPHDVSAKSETVQINATGYQWYWEMDKEEIPLGKSAVFNVHTKDVTHGLGVTDPDGKLLFQTQAMPGYINRVKYTFTKPGTYKIICMEFCGIAHHDMISEIKVIAKKE